MIALAIMSKTYTGSPKAQNNKLATINKRFFTFKEGIIKCNKNTIGKNIQIKTNELNVIYIKKKKKSIINDNNHKLSYD